MKTSRLKELVKKYLDGELNGSERKELSKLLEQVDTHAELEGQFQEEWDRTAGYQDNALSEQARLRIKAIMDKIGDGNRRTRNIWPWLSAACILLFCLALPFIWNREEGEDIEIVAALHRIEASYGQKKTVRMADGSVIHLNSGSVLEYTSDYNLSNRDVRITGEAYFEVSPNKDLPFTVQGQGIYAEVLGTVFDFRAFDEEGEVSVALESGALKVAKLGDTSGQVSPAFLKPGQKAIYRKSDEKIAVRAIDRLDAWGQWRNEILTFNAAPFLQVASTLERWYDVKIHFSNASLKKSQFTGSFDNLPVNRVLDLLKKSRDFSYRIEGKDIYIE